MKFNWNNSAAGYGWLSIILHWLMLILIVATYTTINLKSFFPRESASRELVVSLHFMLGLSIFGLVWLRLWARAVGSNPAVLPVLPTRQVLLAKLMHWALYALMIGLPVLGWLTLSAKGKPVPFYGTELPALIDKSQELAKLFKNIHKTLGQTGYFLVGLHAAATLYHHYVKRDNTLLLMLPGKK
jgi:cytochrome b561